MELHKSSFDNLKNTLLNEIKNLKYGEKAFGRNQKNREKVLWRNQKYRKKAYKRYGKSQFLNRKF